MKKTKKRKAENEEERETLRGNDGIRGGGRRKGQTQKRVDGGRDREGRK